MSVEDQSPKFSLFHRGSLQSRDIIQSWKQASFTVTVIKANTSSSQWIREVKLQLRSPSEPVSVCYICITGKIHKVSYAIDKAYFEKKVFEETESKK